MYLYRISPPLFIPWGHCKENENLKQTISTRSNSRLKPLFLRGAMSSFGLKYEYLYI